MRFWTRELFGWMLVGLGIFFFWLSYRFCEAYHIFEAWPMAIIGIFVFRGGIHLLKVAVAARVCLEAQERLYPPTAPERLPGG
jgi:hypothetical protein